MNTSINWDDFHAYISNYSDDIKADMIRYIQGELSTEEVEDSVSEHEAEMEEYYKTHCSCGALKADCCDWIPEEES
jgi:hypothetical protein